MKNYDELTKTLLTRRDDYILKQKKQRKMLTAVMASVCCFCLTAMIGIGAWNIPKDTTNIPRQTSEDALYLENTDCIYPKNEVPDNPKTYNVIIVNSLERINTTKMNIALMTNDFTKMTKSELIEYYGINFVPAVPENLKIAREDHFGIFKRNSGTGEVYWDANRIEYSNEDGTQKLILEADKGNYVFFDYFYFKGKEQKSFIKNTEIMIGKTSDDILYAEFMYKNVGFYLCAEGLTKSELVSIIESIIQ